MVCVCVCVCVFVCVCVCVCVLVHVCVRADPIILVFVPGVEYGFLCVYNVMWGLFEGICLNIVVIVTCFVASVMLYLLLHVFILYIAIAKGIVLIFVKALYKSPLLLSLSLYSTCITIAQTDTTHVAYSYGLWHSESSPAFKTALKTQLFRSAY